MFKAGSLSGKHNFFVLFVTGELLKALKVTSRICFSIVNVEMHISEDG